MHDNLLAIRDAGKDMITRRNLLIATGSAAVASCASASRADMDMTLQPNPAADLRLISEALERLESFQDLRAGGPGDIACGDWLDAHLSRHGFETHRQVFDTPFFEPTTSLLRAGGKQAPVYPQGIVVPTGPDGVTGPLRIWHRPGDVPDAKGSVVMMVLPWARHSQLAQADLKAAIRPVAEAGASAIVLVTTGPSGERIALNADPNEPAWPQPMAVIGPKDAEPFYAIAREAGDATLITDGIGGRRPAFNLVGQIDRPGPRIVISTPRSGWGPCMGERGPGIAVFYALAASLPDALPDHALTFVANSGHEYDNLGSHHFISKAAPPAEDTRVWFHLGAGFAARDWHEIGGQLLPLKSADPQRFLVGSEHLLPVLQKTFAGLAGLEVPYPARLGASGELGEILAAGYPNAVGMLGAHRFHHAANDTMDKTGSELIVPVLDSVRATLLQIA